MSGESFNYKFGRKNQWRRTIHNQIVKRLSVPPRDAVVLYLAGEMDLDRAEFIKRGFKPRNLIAVEIDADVAQSLRADGKLCLKADLCDVTRNWAKDQVHVLFADLCCGLTNSILDKFVPSLIKNPCFDSCICAVNLLRGRDKGAANLLKDLFNNITKHRGEAFYVYLTNLLGRYAVEYSRLSKFGPTAQKWVENASRLPRRICYDFLLSKSLHESRLYFATYKSPEANQVFDSIVFTNTTMFTFARFSILWSLLRIRNGTDSIEDFKSYLTYERYDAEWLSCDDKLNEMLSRVIAACSPANKEINAQLLRLDKADLSNPVARQISAIKARRTMMEQQIA